MSIYEYFNLLEGAYFTAFLDVASGFSTFYNALNMSSEVIAFMSLASQDLEILKKRFVLVLQNHEASTRHPHDVTLSVYLYVLNTYEDIDMALLNRLANQHTLWWTRKLAEFLLAQNLISQKPKISVRYTANTIDNEFKLKQSGLWEVGTNTNIVFKIDSPKSQNDISRAETFFAEGAD